MPTPISLPEIPIGDVVSGDVVLRNVVVNVPSTRFAKPDANSPAMPLDGRPYNPSLPQLPQKEAPATQFSKDLKFVDPFTMPADSFSVLIDNVSGVVIKANPEETNLFIQQGAFYLGSFDSATADLVIKDMIENPIPTEEELIARAFDANMHLYLTAYMTGAIMFSQYKNAKENWGNYVPFDQVMTDKILTPNITVPVNQTSNFPKTAVIKVDCLNVTDSVLVEGVMMPRCLVNGLQVFRQYAGAYDGSIGKYVEKEWKNQPPNWSWKMLPQSSSFQLIYHPTVQNKYPHSAEYVIANSTQNESIWNYIIRLNQIRSDMIFALETQSLAPVNFSPAVTLPTKPNLQLPNVPPQIEDKVEQYVAINEQLAELVRTGQDVVIDNVTPFTNQELVDLTNQGLATVENVVNPNAGNTEGEQILYEYIEINYSNGTSTSTWKPIGRMKDFDCTKRGSERMRDGNILEFCILPNGRKGYILKQGSVPTIIPSSEIIKATINPTPQFQQLATIRDQIGQQLGVPAGCTPQNPTVLPPSVVPSNCVPINPIRVPIVREPQPTPQIQPVPPSGGGGGGGTIADKDTIDPALGVQGGGFIILPRPNSQGGQAVHYPSGKQFTIVSDGKGGAKIGSYIAGTGLNA